MRSTILPGTLSGTDRLRKARRHWTGRLPHSERTARPTSRKRARDLAFLLWQRSRDGSCVSSAHCHTFRREVGASTRWRVALSKTRCGRCHPGILDSCSCASATRLDRERPAPGTNEKPGRSVKRRSTVTFHRLAQRRVCLDEKPLGP